MEYDAKSLIQTLAKGLAVLECFKSDTDELGITELGILSDLPESTVQRIINTLEIKSYIIQNPVNRKYRLSLKPLTQDGTNKRLKVWLEKSKQYMLSLNEITEETINLAIRDEDSLIYLTKVDSRHLLRPNFVIGERYPLYCTGLGRCLLSDISDDKFNLFIPENIEKITPYTKTNRAEIKKDCERIREVGYIIDDEEFTAGLYCVAVPIYAFDKKVIAALSVTTPKIRVNPNNIQDLIKCTMDTAKNISNEYSLIMS